MEKNAIAILVVFASCLLVSCAAKEPVGEVVAGNFDFAAGDYEGATLEYFRALKSGVCEAWVRFNLGNVYERLGEPDYAVKELSKALPVADTELIFRTHFNLGNIFFEGGEYESAFNQYKEALRIKPASKDAKKNLEIAVKKIENEEHKRAASQSGETRMTSEVIQTLKNA